MLLRELGLKVLELEAGPYTFLLVDCVPVAYKDTTQEVAQYYRTSAYIRKGVTKALNRWLKNKPVAELPQADIQAAFQGLSRFGPEISRERRMQGRRSEDQTLDPRVKQLAEALVSIMGNGKP